jgi:hypothetical protein
MRDGHGDQLLGLARQSAVGEGLLAECIECLMNRGSELAAARADLAGSGG